MKSLKEWLDIYLTNKPRYKLGVVYYVHCMLLYKNTNSNNTCFWGTEQLTILAYSYPYSNDWFRYNSFIIFHFLSYNNFITDMGSACIIGDNCGAGKLKNITVIKITATKIAWRTTNFPGACVACHPNLHKKSPWPQSSFWSGTSNDILESRSEASIIHKHCCIEKISFPTKF